MAPEHVWKRQPPTWSYHAVKTGSSHCYSLINMRPLELLHREDDARSDSFLHNTVIYMYSIYCGQELIWAKSPYVGLLGLNCLLLAMEEQSGNWNHLLTLPVVSWTTLCTDALNRCTTSAFPRTDIISATLAPRC